LYLRNHRSELKCAYENYGNNRGINGPGHRNEPSFKHVTGNVTGSKASLPLHEKQLMMLAK